MEIKEIAVAKIKPAAYNPRKDLKPTDQEYQKIKASIERFGFVQPFVWNRRTGNLVAGHQRFKVLMEKKPRTLPCIVVDYDDAQERAANIALNKIAGEWDFSKAREILVDLDASGLLNLTGFDEIELKNMVDWNATADMDKFKKGTFENILDGAKFTDKKNAKDGNWFYVEFFGQDELFQELSAILQDMLTTTHQLDPEKFKEMVYGLRAKAKK